MNTSKVSRFTRNRARRRRHRKYIQAMEDEYGYEADNETTEPVEEHNSDNRSGD